jgi:hypothetical protein
MSYQEKNITVTLVSTLFIGGYFGINIYQMIQAGGLVPDKVFRLWVIVIVVTILVNIISSILTNIVLSIVHAIKTRSDEEERFIEDERDRLIGLKGTKVSYITFSIGVLISMLTFVSGQPGLVMFSLIIFFSLLSEVFGDIAQIVLYRRGF